MKPLKQSTLLCFLADYVLIFLQVLSVFFIFSKRRNYLYKHSSIYEFVKPRKTFQNRWEFFLILHLNFLVFYFQESHAYYPEYSTIKVLQET